MDLRPGQPVTIADGVFAGMDGKVVGTYKAPGSALPLVRVQVEVLGRPVPVELEPHQLEGGPAPRPHIRGTPVLPRRGHIPMTVLPEAGSPPRGGGDRPAAPLLKDAVPGWQRPWQLSRKGATGGVGAVLGALAGLGLVLLGAWLADEWLDHGQGTWLAPALVGAFTGAALGLLTRRKGGAS